MRKAIAIFACTSLVAAGVWIAGNGRSVAPLSADVEIEPNAFGRAGQVSARDSLKMGATHYSEGRYRDAVEAFETAAQYAGELNEFEQRQLEAYLGQARRRAGRSVFGNNRSIQPPVYPDYEQTARRQLAEAQRLADSGDVAGARAVAERAADSPVNWSEDEPSPNGLLRALEQAAGPAPAAAARANGGAIQPASYQDGADSYPAEDSARERPLSFAQLAGMGETTKDLGPLAPEPDAPLTPREQALRLMAEAELDLRAGRFAEAREKAVVADRIPVEWSLYEKTPRQVLNAIERTSETTTISRAANVDYGPRPEGGETSADDFLTEPSVRNRFEDPAFADEPQQTRTPAEQPEFIARKQRAAELLARARRELDAGRFDSAAALAEEAGRMNVSFGVFEERPEMILSDVNRLQNAANIAANDAQPGDSAGNRESEAPFGRSAESEAPTTQKTAATKRRAVDLLAQSRAALQAGNVGDARRLAEEANQFEVPYALFEDQPKHIIAAIDARGRTPAANIADSRGAEDRNDSAVEVRPPSAFDPAMKQRAVDLLQAARADLNEGRVDDAREKAEQARQMNVSYNVIDDRPEHVLTDVERYVVSMREAATENAATDDASTSVDVAFDPDRPIGVAAEMRTDPNVTPSGADLDPRQDAGVTTADGTAAEFGRNEFASGRASIAARRAETELADLGVIHPEGASARDLYDLGLEHLRSGNRSAAYDAFLQAWQSGQQLDGYRNQQLQDFLRELGPRNGRGIRQASAVGGTSEVLRPAASTNIDAAEQEVSVKYQRLRTKTMNAVFRADRMHKQDPNKALEILDRATATLEGSDLGRERVAPLISQVHNSRLAVESHVETHKPIIDMNARNAEVRRSIDERMKYKIQIEQEIADLVDDYNMLFKQRRYAEAELRAKQAKELDPENPVTETMLWKARFARRNEVNNEIRDGKEQYFVEALNDVDRASIGITGEIEYPKEWKELTKRRKKYGRADNRRRTEEDERIERSLSKRISLNFDNAPLRDVIRHVATVADVNVVLDDLGLEEEGVTTDTPVAIDVTGITLKSALNLLLEPLRLSYTIEDEVLKITSRMRQQGRLVVATYPVGDLVIPIPNYNPGMGAGMASGGGGATGGAFAGGNWSVPSSGGMQTPTGAQFQVQDPLGNFGVPNVPNVNGVGPVGVNPIVAGANGPQARIAGGGNAVDFDTISDLIVSTVEPESWDEYGGPGSVRHFETTLSLVIRQTQKVHDEIADLLAQLRRLQDLQVTVEVRIVNVTDNFFERVGVDFDFDVNDNVGPRKPDPTLFPPFGTPMGMLLGQMAGMMGGGIGFFDFPDRFLTEQDDWPTPGYVVGLAGPDGAGFTPDLDVGFRQGSFGIGIPQFGGFQPNTGLSVGMAILSDIEAFFFIEATQGDSRSNVLSAPKVTLFNGQTAFISNTRQQPFVTSLIPTVGVFSVGFTPQITVIAAGPSLSVSAVISADRRYVRLTLTPTFITLVDVATFSFISGAPGLGGGGGGGLGGGGGGGGAIGIGGIGGGAQNFGGAANEQVEMSILDESSMGYGGMGGIGGGSMARNMLTMTVPRQQPNMGAAGMITIQQPIIDVTTISTTVSVPDGGTVLLGGVKSLSEARTFNGVPVLNKVPYVSRLFKNTGVGRETNSVMLMVTPRIIIQEEEEELLGIPTSL